MIINELCTIVYFTWHRHMLFFLLLVIVLNYNQVYSQILSIKYIVKKDLIIEIHIKIWYPNKEFGNK